MRVLYVSLFVLLADQISKLFVKGFSIPFLNIHFEGMRIGQSLSVIGDFFKITFVENPGMAFGIDVNGYSKLFLSLFSLAAAIGLTIYIYKIRNDKVINRLALALILGGALGNFVDRAFYGLFYNYAPFLYGRVVDFFQVEFWDFTLFGRTYETWPIFNVADSAVTVGVVLMFFFHRKDNPAESEETVPEGEDTEVIIPSEDGDVTLAVEQGIVVDESEIVIEDKTTTNNDSLNGEDNNRKET